MSRPGYGEWLAVHAVCPRPDSQVAADFATRVKLRSCSNHPDGPSCRNVSQRARKGALSAIECEDAGGRTCRIKVKASDRPRCDGRDTVEATPRRPRREPRQWHSVHGADTRYVW